MEVYGAAIQKPLSNKDLEVCLAECRKITKDDWVIQEWKVEPTWRDNLVGRKPESLYSLCLSFGGTYQLINFYRSQGISSINTKVSADLVMAYLLGASNPPVQNAK